MTGQKIMFYTKDQIAEMLQVNIRTVERYIEKGLLKYYKIEGKTRIKAEDFEEFLEQHKGESENKLSGD